MEWTVRLSHRAVKALQRMGAKDRRLMGIALAQIGRNPFQGDVRRLIGQPAVLRHRAGAWRLFLDVDLEEMLVDVTAIERRTSTTYRKR